MKIGFNLLFLLPGKVGGTETYSRGLLAGLEKRQGNNNYVVFCNKENFKSFQFKKKNFRKVLCPIKASFRPLRILWEQLMLPFQVWSQKIDVLISLGYVCPFFLPCQSMVVIYDLNWFFHPEEFSFLECLVWRILVSFSAKRANVIITSSQNSKRDIVKVLKISQEKVIVVYGGIDEKRFRPIKEKEKISVIKEKYGLKDKFLLTVSPSYKFKNLKGLVEAFNLVVKRFPDLQLLIVGLGGKGKSEMLDKIKNNKLEKKIIIAGWVPDEDLPILYSAAEVYVHPSLYEGFGFPVLEAMACGCPVLSSKAASLPELVADAGMMIDMTKGENIYKAIKQLLNDAGLRKELKKRGFNRSKNFSWQKTTETFLQIFPLRIVK